MPRRSSRDRERQWSRTIAAWKQSGQTQAAYCGERGISIHTFRWWKRRLRNAAPSDEHQHDDALVTTLVPVTVKGDAPSEPIEIVVSNDRRIRVSARFDEALLRQVISVVESTPCSR